MIDLKKDQKTLEKFQWKSITINTTSYGAHGTSPVETKVSQKISYGESIFCPICNKSESECLKEWNKI